MSGAWLLCRACCFYLLISFLGVCLGRLLWFEFGFGLGFLTLLKNKLQSAGNLTFHCPWLGTDACL